MSRHSFTPYGVAILLLAVLWAGGAPAATDGELQAAREELGLRAETERRMRRDFESLLAGGQMTPAEIADFEDYLASLGMLVEQQRRVVAKLEGVDPDPGVAGTATGSLPADFDRGQTDEEKIALLDAELGGSLSAFDEKLLREQKEIAEKSRNASTGDSGSPDGSSNDGAKGQGQGSEGQAGDESGKDGAESAAGSTEAGGRTGEESGEQGEPGAEGEAAGKGQEGGEQVASAGGPSEAGGQSGKTGVPPDIPDGKDDDVVARQLREAAENEQDPELREKLWDEYRRYKSSTQ